MNPSHGSHGSQDAPQVCVCARIRPGEEHLPLCCVEVGKLCSRSAFCFCREVFISVIAGEGSLGGAGKQPGLPSPNICRRSHREKFPCDVKRCRAQGRARTRVCPAVPPALGTPGSMGVSGAQIPGNTTRNNVGVRGLAGGSCCTPGHPVTHRGSVVRTHNSHTPQSPPTSPSPLEPPKPTTHRETPHTPPRPLRTSLPSSHVPRGLTCP